MNKTKFLELVKNPDLIEERDLTKLDELISEHPYSQIIHVLKVKGHKVFDRPDYDESLNLAATYTYDRGILRSILEGPQPVEYDSSTVSTTAPETDETEPEETSDFEWIHDGDDDDIFVDEIIETVDRNVLESDEQDKETDQDLGMAYEAEHEQLAEERESPTVKEQEPSVPDEQEPVGAVEKRATEDKAPETPVDQSKILETSDSQPPEIETTASPAEESAVEENQSTEEDAKTSDSTQLEQSGQQADEDSSSSSEETTVKGTPVETPKVIEKREKDLLDLEIEAGSIHAELMKNLNQLQENKQQFIEKPEGNKNPENLEEQIEIIDNFIKNSPVLSKPNLSAESEGTSQDDLSKNSTKLNHELVTENLARIYIKQGKGKDAEKIYKKLIRKFPQKKAYFADQIRKIKKK